MQPGVGDPEHRGVGGQRMPALGRGKDKEMDSYLVHMEETQLSLPAQALISA